MKFIQRNYFYAMALMVPLFIIGLLYFRFVAFLCVAGWLLQMFGVLGLRAQMRAERLRAER
jgi:hypothetical protein